LDVAPVAAPDVRARENGARAPEGGDEAGHERDGTSRASSAPEP